MKTSRIFLFMIALSLFSCDSDSEKLNHEQILRVLKDAKQTQTIGVSSFQLEACIWRDFMPICPIDGKEMISINWLVSTDSPIPDHINMVKQYVIYKGEIWEADYENESYPVHSNKLERISRNGPKWDTGIYVTVVSQIYDSKTKTTYYVKCDNVIVGRTD